VVGGAWAVEGAGVTEQDVVLTKRGLEVYEIADRQRRYSGLGREEKVDRVGRVGSTAPRARRGPADPRARRGPADPRARRGPADPRTRLASGIEARATQSS
jgi:hypothetical protein